MSDTKKPYIIAVDFDGTLCADKWPEIGEANEELIEHLQKRRSDGNKLILWTNRIGERLKEAVAWCKERGLEFDAVNENLPEIIESFGGDCRKIFANEYIDDRSALYPGLPFTGEPTWQETEIRLACERELEFDTSDAQYGVMCYHSALRAYQCLARDGHSGASIAITKGILNRLLDGKCLTPIEDTEDVWEEISYTTDGTEKASRHYQCKRMSAFFKDVAPDGTVTYSDVSRVNCINVDNPNVPYHNGLATRLIDKIFPITMPYFPAAKKVTVVRDEFLVDPKNGDYDTVAFLYLIAPDGKKIELNRYFKEENGEMVSIEKGEFEKRKTKRVEKK